MAKSKTHFEDSHRKNSEQARKRIKKFRRIAGVEKPDTNRVWLRSRRRLRRGLLDR